MEKSTFQIQQKISKAPTITAAPCSHLLRSVEIKHPANAAFIKRIAGFHTITPIRQTRPLTKHIGLVFAGW